MTLRSFLAGPWLCVEVKYLVFNHLTDGEQCPICAHTHSNLLPEPAEPLQSDTFPAVLDRFGAGVLAPPLLCAQTNYRWVYVPFLHFPSFTYFCVGHLMPKSRRCASESVSIKFSSCWFGSAIILTLCAVFQAIGDVVRRSVSTPGEHWDLEIFSALLLMCCNKHAIICNI